MFVKVINSFLTDAPSVFTILIFTLLHETDLKDACCVLKKVVSGSHFSVVIRTTDIQRVPFRKRGIRREIRRKSKLFYQE